VENKLPKDELYLEIEAAHQEKARRKKALAEGITLAPVLPKVKISN